jgi:hypothetical protein
MREHAANSHTLAQGQARGQKAPFKPKEIWAIRARLRMENRARELALFDLAWHRS